MARPTRTLIDALRAAADRLRRGADYSWTHMGSCNCGHLVQQLTHRSKSEIHQMALQKAGDWGQQAVDHCPVSGYPIDHIITTMIEAGLTHQDIHDLERLASRRVLATLPPGERVLNYRSRPDVVRYMRAWADQLETQLRRHELSPSHELDRVAKSGMVRTAERPAALSTATNRR